ncbi:hypothetical protein FHU36_008235 [Nonomuraea muscovyensis]|uniref:DUF308 domain-containing protein n=1 Tax=Nonomuraea muscovyensis TaxID=1124761 RepID=A0A7X0CB91_9ACTN|nr:hypothetical protein [Nonomuraea muscovyensis]MBB6351652.1 hypothetical protein [Nonomuraea muscovyensis]
MPSGVSSPGATVLGPTAGQRAFFWLGAPVLGAGAGWLLKLLVGWVSSLPWTPFEGPLRLIKSIPPTPLTIGAVTVGVVAGLLLALVAEHYYVKVTVGADEVAVACRDSRREVARSAVAGVFHDAKHLVILGHDTGELVRQGGDLPSRERLADAFLAHGYLWLADGDPYEEDFQRWVEGHPGLSAAAHAILKARTRALEKGDAEDAEELRLELAKLGVVVREEKKRQWWRRTDRPDELDALDPA